MMSPEEELTWSRIQQKDRQVFDLYYEEHYSGFFLMACKYLRDPALSEEIVNDVFVKLWQDGKQIRIESSLKAYIYRAVINRSIDALRTQNKYKENQLELRWRPEETVELREVEENELKVRIYKAIDELPPQARKVFMMSRFEELKQHEIADRLGISIKTVKNHISYALRHMSSALGDYNFLWIGWLTLGLRPFFVCHIIEAYGLFTHK